MPVTRKQTGRASRARSMRAALVCALVTLGVLVQAVPAMAAPILTSAPELSRSGRTLSTSNGSYLPAATSHSYGWQRCDTSGAGCAGVPGRTGPTYLLTTADIGKRIRSIVTVTSGLGPGTAASEPTATIVAAPPANVVPPTVTVSGATLNSTVGSWSDPSPGNLAYLRRWQRCTAAGGLNCQDIAGATGATYKPTSADVGKFIRVIASAEGLGKSSVASAPVGPIVAPPSPGGGGEPGGARDDPGGGGSTPTDGLRKLRPFPRVIIAGRLARGRTFISGLSVRKGPNGATVSVRCRGRGCPKGGFRKKLGRSGNMRLKRYQRVFRPGAIIEIRITKHGEIGKFTRVRVRRRSVPSRRDSCLKPGSSKPSRCP